MICNRELPKEVPMNTYPSNIQDLDRSAISSNSYGSLHTKPEAQTCRQ